MAMETNKLTIIEIRYIRSLAAVKTDEELAVMIEKPVELIKAQFALMAGLPRRPGEKIVLEKLPPPPEPIIHPAGIVNNVPISPKKSKVREAGSQLDKQAKKERMKPGPKPKNPVKKKKADKQHSAHAQAEERKRCRSISNNKKVFVTRPIDLTGKVAYKLNSKTTVYEAPGADIEQLKKKYKIV